MTSTFTRVGRRAAAVLAVLGIVFAALGDGAPTAAAGQTAPIDPILKVVAAKKPSQVVPVIVERTTTTAAEGAIRARGGVIDRHLNTGKAVVAEVPAGAVAALAAQPGVLRVSYDAPVVDQAAPDWDARPLATVYPGAVGATGLWSSGVTGRGVGVAVLDSGVHQHVDFQADTATGRAETRLIDRAAVALDSAGSLDDDYGHGTWVAGVVGGHGWGDWSTPGDRDDQRYVGVAIDANLIGVKVSNKNGVSRVSDAIAGVEWTIANKDRLNIRVLNMSLVSTVPESYHTSLLDTAVEYAWLRGIVVVVAAGNAGPDTMHYPPANDPFAIVVGATDDNGTVSTADDQRVWFSSYGTTQDGLAKPDLVAPGRRIVSTLASPNAPLAREFPDRIVDGHYIRLSGTSAAAPVVSGVAALLLQARPDLRPDQVKWLLEQTAQGVPGPGTGAGEPSAGAAVRYAGAIGHANRDVAPSLYLLRSFLAATHRTSFTENGWDAFDWTENGWDAVAFSENGWDVSSFTENGWDTTAYVENGWDVTAYAENGWDATRFLTVEHTILGD